MEILYKQFENLLSAFLKEFLEKVNSSSHFAPETELPEEFSAEYWNYLEEFTRLQEKIVNCAPTSKEDILKRSQALTILRDSSQAIFKTFNSA
jgi:hypothetical protein